MPEVRGFDFMNLSYQQLYQLAKHADQENRPAEAVEFFKAAFKINNLMPANARLRLADNLRIIGRFDEAFGVFESIKDADVPVSKSWLVDLHMGQFYMDMCDFFSAVACFKRAIQKHADETIPYIYLAAAYSQMQQSEQAIEVLLSGLKAEGDRDEVYLNLGYNYRTVGKYDLAKEAFENALLLTPDYQEAHDGINDVTSALKAIERIMGQT